MFGPDISDYAGMVVSTTPDNTPVTKEESTDVSDHDFGVLALVLITPFFLLILYVVLGLFVLLPILGLCCYKLYRPIIDYGHRRGFLRIGLCIVLPAILYYVCI